MPETASFTTLTRLALSNLRNKRLWWFCIPAGICIALSTFYASKASSLIAEKDSTALLSFLQDELGHVFLALLGISFLFRIGEAPLRGIVIPLLQFIHLKQKDESLKHPSWKDLLHGAKKAFFFEFGFLGFITLLGGILLIPSLLAWKFNQHAFIPLFEIGFILLLGISFYLYFIKELSLFYCLLGKIGLRESINLGFRIFRRHSFLTVLFFIYLSMIGFIVTACIDLFVRLTPFVFAGPRNDVLPLIVSIPLFGFYFLFDQALRLTYFRHIAASPKDRAKKVSMAKEMDRATGTTNI